MLGTERQNLMKNLKSFCSRLSKSVARKMRRIVSGAGLAGACAGLALAFQPVQAHAGYDDLTTSLTGGTNFVAAASTNILRNTADTMTIQSARFVAMNLQFKAPSASVDALIIRYDLGVKVRGSNYWTTNAIAFSTATAFGTTNVSYGTNFDLGGFTLMRAGQIENSGATYKTNIFNAGNCKDGV